MNNNLPIKKSFYILYLAALITFFHPITYAQQTDFYGLLRLYNDSCHKSLNIHTSLKSTEDFNLDTIAKKFNLHPIISGELRNDLNTKANFYNANIGLKTGLNFKNRFITDWVFLTGQETFPTYIHDVIQKNKIVPGYGIAYYGKGNSYVYTLNTFKIQYRTKRYFAFELGNGKNFIGEGYRSLLLSDNASNYPYFKINTKIWHFDYVNIFANLKDSNDSLPFDKKHKNKYAIFHYLSYNACKWLNISIFESVVFHNRNKDPYKFGFDVNYLNPVIFYRPVEYSLGSADNSVIGASFKLRPLKNIVLYGQVVVDEFYLQYVRSQSGWWGNKQGLQIGGKWLKAFWIKNLTALAEYNTIRPYTYSHGDPLINYAHFNQALAHPLGANFKELIGMLFYTHNKWRISAKTNYIEIGLDENGKNYGHNIYTSYYSHVKDVGNYTTQGLKTTMLIVDMWADYKPFKRSSTTIFIDVTYRMLSNALIQTKTPLISAGVRANLFNQYLDF